MATLVMLNTDKHSRCETNVFGLLDYKGKPANPGSPGKMAIKTECVCVCDQFEQRSVKVL